MKADASKCVARNEGDRWRERAWVELGQVGGCLVGRSVPAAGPTSLDYTQRHAFYLPRSMYLYEIFIKSNFQSGS